MPPWVKDLLHVLKGATSSTKPPSKQGGGGLNKAPMPRAIIERQPEPAEEHVRHESPAPSDSQSAVLVETFRNLPNRLLELPNYGLWQATSFLFYWPETAGCSLTLQTLRNLPNRRLELPAVAGQVFPFFPGPQLPDAPFKPSKPSETCQTVSWCQTMDTSCRSK